MDSAEARRQRAALRRQTWTFALRDGERAAQATDSTPESRLASMWGLALDAWVLTGQPLPEYERANMPGRVIRPGGG